MKECLKSYCITKLLFGQDSDKPVSKKIFFNFERCEKLQVANELLFLGKLETFSDLKN